MNHNGSNNDDDDDVTTPPKKEFISWALPRNSPRRIKHFYLDLNGPYGEHDWVMRETALANLLTDFGVEFWACSVVVFAMSEQKVERLAEAFSGDEHSSRFTTSLGRSRCEPNLVLLATDASVCYGEAIMERATMIVNFEVPKNDTQYTYLMSELARRGGKPATAITLVTTEDKAGFLALSSHFAHDIPPLPENLSDIPGDGVTAWRIDHFCVEIAETSDPDWEARETLRDLLSEFGAGSAVVVFARSKKVELLAEGFSADTNGSCFTMCLKRFRCEPNLVLFAPDASAERTDVESAAVVVNFEVPEDDMQYTERVGGWARRGGNLRMAITLVTTEDWRPSPWSRPKTGFLALSGHLAYDIAPFPMDLRPSIKHFYAGIAETGDTPRPSRRVWAIMFGTGSVGTGSAVVFAWSKEKIEFLRGFVRRQARLLLHHKPRSLSMRAQPRALCHRCQCGSD